MIFLNADNNLEFFALANFRQMAQVANTDRVNIVVQFDRIAKYAHTTPDWSNTLRFRITNAMEPLPNSAIEDIGEADMGSGATLQAFIEWSMRRYPARRYMLVLWDHGQGWRADPKTMMLRGATPTASPYRTISNDETNNSKLYLHDVQDAVRAAMRGRRLDVIGFDACLMAMVESAYAFRDLADVMVGSQELEPGFGWRYDWWLQNLVDNPNMDSRALGKVIVAQYQNAYGVPGTPSYDPETTLSAFDLREMPTLIQSLDALAKSLTTTPSTDFKMVIDARNACPVYAPNAFSDGKEYFFHIDLGCFADELGRTSPSSPLAHSARAVKSHISAGTFANYIGSDRRTYGSNGLAIYFPPSKQAYANDLYAENGYEKSNTFKTVEFVQKTAWPDFLKLYFERVP